MAKTDSLQGSLDLLVLKILSRRPQLHGYAIMAAIASTSGEVLRAEEGSLYPALYRMEEAGWIRAERIKKFEWPGALSLSSPIRILAGGSSTETRSRPRPLCFR